MKTLLALIALCATLACPPAVSAQGSGPAARAASIEETVVTASVYHFLGGGPARLLEREKACWADVLKAREGKERSMLVCGLLAYSNHKLVQGFQGIEGRSVDAEFHADAVRDRFVALAITHGASDAQAKLYWTIFAHDKPDAILEALRRRGVNAYRD